MVSLFFVAHKSGASDVASGNDMVERFGLSLLLDSSTDISML